MKNTTTIIAIIMALLLSFVMSNADDHMSMDNKAEEKVQLNDRVIWKLDNIIEKINSFDEDRIEEVKWILQDRHDDTKSPFKKLIYKYVIDNIWTEMSSVDESSTILVEATSTPWEYLDYSKDAIWMKENTVLFFHATWCPTCKAADQDINENLDSIPSDMSILKVDYDTNKNLRKQYKVTIQHTFVQVDDKWKLIKKWVGWSQLDDIINNIE